MKKFNTTGVCIPSKHYMVDLSERVAEIKKMVDDGKYFVINRARQYGKTTTLYALQKAIADEYAVLALDFQNIGNAAFESESSFSKAIARIILDAHEFADLDVPEDMILALEQLNASNPQLDELFRIWKRWIKKSERPLVLIVDEVDSATNNQVFLDFLAMLREGYISRDTRGVPAFQSVILAGVTDIRHLKAKIREDAASRQNSPWNIAADFTVDMSLSESGIKGMLDDYEADHHTGMDTGTIAKQLRAYTNGYPFLVSRLCQLMDEMVGEKMALSQAWTMKGFDEAVKLILAENNPLFQTINKNLNNFPSFKVNIRRILMEGERMPWSPDQNDIEQMQMYGLIRRENNTVRIANRIFETRLYNFFLSDEEMKHNEFYKEGDRAQSMFITDGRLNVRLILAHFIETYHQIYGPLEEKFTEKDGRELFLLYLRPIINGTGNYYIEAETRDQKRTDVIVDYLGQQYIIELKIWHGERYNTEGEKQIIGYLDRYRLTTGYMLSFNFNKNKEPGVKQVQIGDKLLYEGTV